VDALSFPDNKPIFPCIGKSPEYNITTDMADEAIRT